MDGGESPAGLAAALDRGVDHNHLHRRAQRQIPGRLDQRPVNVHSPATAATSKPAAAITSKIHLDNLAGDANILDDIPFERKQRTNAVHIHGSTSCRSMMLVKPLNKQGLSLFQALRSPATVKKGHFHV
jgi:hypothetical protein